jgi:hypothetical protein
VRGPVPANIDRLISKNPLTRARAKKPPSRYRQKLPTGYSEYARTLLPPQIIFVIGNDRYRAKPCVGCVGCVAYSTGYSIAPSESMIGHRVTRDRPRSHLGRPCSTSNQPDRPAQSLYPTLVGLRKSRLDCAVAGWCCGRGGGGEGERYGRFCPHARVREGAGVARRSWATFQVGAFMATFRLRETIPTRPVPKPVGARDRVGSNKTGSDWLRPRTSRP